MSGKSGIPPTNKCLSAEGPFSKHKDDRVRSNNNAKYKQYHDGGNCSKQYSNGRNPSNKYYKQPKPRTMWTGKKSQDTKILEKIGGRKGNLNHMLNFKYESDDSLYGRFRVVPHLRGGNRSGPYNKEKFIQANCQLILKEGGDYSMYSSDADAIIEWDHIEKVNMWSCESPSCPIRLYEPYAAHITKCGHIFCWPCILHYLALDDKSWRKCPICHEAVKKNDLKSVTVKEEKSYNIQSFITMKLKTRTRGSLISRDEVSTACAPEDLYKFNDTSSTQDQRNMKYLVASQKQILENVVVPERQQLEFKLSIETDESENSFIQSALELCKLREDSLKSSGIIMTTSEIDVGKSLLLEGQDGSEDNELYYDAISGDNHRIAELLVDEDGSKDHIYYFYQAADAQHVYLHPVNFRCLLHQYGSYKNCPAEISAKIVEVNRFTMNEELRKRHRYLSHLPLSLEFCIVELDLRSPVVSKATLSLFREELERRVVQRRKKARDEKRIMKKMQNDTLRKQGKYPEARISLESQQQFPPMQRQNASGSFSVLLPSPEMTTLCPDDVIKASSSSAVASHNDIVHSEAGPSFVEMLKSPRPDRVAARPCSASMRVRTTSQGEEDDVTPPNYQSAFSDALSSALEKMPLPSGSGRKGKKRKKSQVLLFSTSSQQHQ